MKATSPGESHQTATGAVHFRVSGNKASDAAVPEQGRTRQVGAGLHCQLLTLFLGGLVTRCLGSRRLVAAPFLRLVFLPLADARLFTTIDPT
jgi:hypothetical protein